ncbi:hypothetical protein DICPUDRAFT_26247 [Dictyostelium purpureum]|uniref:Alpha-N-acetylglucosaminidase n=1 Tax=Dictyostelium purpureum TaxID=5786 RepID=F0Z8D8_DICPU|nr:uncharacterized protein DICPUDRAFT_26247 [Dictyostelium purpureum]EGC39824.1 hypothetical protein DICPUDRAFT_26247 [Dictyostelium purpureum]|eukprot:XP_003283691.1 hypothetical protein DICPUDRAFT_26247 [Dictyostelium purpureum]
MTLFFELKISNTQYSKGQYYYISTDVITSQLSNSSTVIVHITADNGVNLAMGLQHYLKYYCQCSYSWNGDQCAIQSFDQLPPVPEPVLVPVVSNFRYYMNVCTFGYSTVWWNWSRWEREIDWMALNGYNLPLAFVGQEYIWYKVFSQIGLSFEQITQWLTGPAFLPWNRMGNVNNWGGPITMDWLEKQRDLQIQILTRMRAYGMKPVLPGFAGHIPGAIQTLFPTANVSILSTWCEFNGTFYLDPSDPLFGKITQLFITELIGVFGTDHYYNFDPFNELAPPSSDLGFLKQTSQQMYNNMLAADPKAVWVLQGWFIVDYPEFWQANQTQAWFSGVPIGGFIVLDLWSDVAPAWNITEYFYGHYWLWCMLHNFGGRSGMYGRIPFIATNPIIARSLSDNMMGTGLTPEAIEQNVVVYDLMSEMAWRSTAPDLEEWITQYTNRRYGKIMPEVVEVWMSMVDTVFNATAYWARRNMGAPESFIALRPSINFGDNVFYDPSVMFNAWHVFSLVNDSYVISTETFQFDISEITMQALSNFFMDTYFNLIKSYNVSDIESFQRESITMMETISFMDLIASTQPELQLGVWTYRARLWAYPDNETPSLQNSSNSATLPYEFNARNQLTLWGPSDSVLHDYAFKLWGGLISDFYGPRWNLFLKTLLQSLENRIPFDANNFISNVQALEQQWVLESTIYPILPFGQGYNTSRYIQSQLQIF